MSYLPLIVCLFAPLGVLLYHRLDPESPITPYLIPKFLGKEKHSKKELRQAGTGWILFSLWLAAMSTSVLSQQTDKNPGGITTVVAAIAFIAPMIAFILFIAGIFYLGQGIFSRKDSVSPALQSMFTADDTRLDFYVQKLMLYTKINLIAVGVAVGILIIEAAFQAGESGPVVLISVASWITAILTFWRMRNYIIKCRVAMKSSKVATLVSIVDHPFLLWYQAWSIRKQYRLMRETPQVRTDPKVSV